MRTPKAVFLDVGWTLVYPRESIWESVSAVAREAGEDVDASKIERLVHTFVTGAREHALAEFESGKAYSDSDEEFAAQFLGLARMIFGATSPAQDHGARSARFFERFWTRGNWEVFPDVLDGIRRLRDGGIAVGVLSNAGSNLTQFLDELGLSRYLDFSVISAVEGTKKPDRRIFQRALTCARVAPEDAVHVGDMFFEDIVGARKLGIRPLLMDRGQHGMFPNHPVSAEHASDGLELVRDLREVLVALGLSRP